MLKVKFRFREGHRDSYNPNSPWVLQNLFLNLTGACNLRCHYCHAHFNGTETHMERGILDTILDQAAAYGPVNIVFTGGEPFLSPHFEYAIRGCQERGLPCKIATNGLFLSQESVDLLVECNVKSLQISLDTLDPDTYAEIKGVPPQSHGILLEGIRRCIGTKKLHVVLSAVADTAVLRELPDVLRFSQRIGADTFTLYHVIPFGRAAERAALPSEKQYLNSVDELISVFASLPEHWMIDLGIPCGRDSGLLKKWAGRIKINPVGCIAGKSTMNILTDGVAVPCVCLADTNLSCGTIREKSLPDLWNAPVMAYFRGEIPVPSCSGCADLGFCRNGCRAMSYLTSDSLTGPDPVCASWKDPLP